MLPDTSHTVAEETKKEQNCLENSPIPDLAKEEGRKLASNVYCAVLQLK